MAIGGAQENTLLTLRGLQERGFSVCLVTGQTASHEGSLEKEVRRLGIPIFFLRQLVREVSPVQDVYALLWLIFFFRKERFDLVHTHTSKAGFLGRLAARVAGVPFVVHTPHGHVFHSYFSKGKTALFLVLERALAPLTDQLIALTRAEQEEHVAQQVGTYSQFTVIPSGILLPERLPGRGLQAKAIRSKLFPEGAKVVGTISRLSPVKGVRVLLESMARLKKEFPEAHLLVVGDGEERSALEERAEQLGLREKVRWAGFQKDIFSFLEAMDLFVLASLNEGMGKAVVQAAACRKAVVVSRIGGLKDLVVPGQTGLLATPGNARDFAQKIALLLSSSQLRAEFGEALFHSLFPAYRADAMVEAIASCYRKLASTRALLRR